MESTLLGQGQLHHTGWSQGCHLQNEGNDKAISEVPSSVTLGSDKEEGAKLNIFCRITSRRHVNQFILLFLISEESGKPKQTAGG